MKKYLDPKIYTAFDKVFGQHENLLISFLNAMLEFNSPIVSVSHLPEELVPYPLHLRTNYINVRCIDADCQSFIVAIQMIWTSDYFKYFLINASTTHSQQATTKLQAEPIYVLCIINDTFNNKPSYWQRYSVLDINKQACKIEGMEFILIELPKFKEQTFFEKSMQVHWLQFLTIEEGPLRYMSIQEIAEQNERRTN